MKYQYHTKGTSNIKIQKKIDGTYIKFDESSMGPYTHIFDNKNTLYDDTGDIRGAENFPFPPENGKTEIFLGQDSILVACGIRNTLAGKVKGFVDIVNIKTQKKGRLYIDEVFLIYHTLIENQERIVVHYSFHGEQKEIIFSCDDISIISENQTNILCDLNTIYTPIETYYLSFQKKGIYKGNLHLDGYFIKSTTRENQEYFDNNYTPIRSFGALLYLYHNKSITTKNILYIWAGAIIIGFLYNNISTFLYFCIFFLVLIFMIHQLLSLIFFQSLERKTNFQNIHIKINPTKQQYILDEYKKKHYSLNVSNQQAIQDFLNSLQISYHVSYHGFLQILSNLNFARFSGIDFEVKIYKNEIQKNTSSFFQKKQ